MSTPEEYRAASLERWSQVASAWERRADQVELTAKVATEWLLEASNLQPGKDVLELACGPAEVGLRVAERVAPSGRVLCSDFSEPMVEVGRRRAASAGRESIEFRVLDAEHLDLPDGSFDAVVCRFGYMLMSDPGGALRESRRVLREGGSLALAVWDGPERNPWASLPMAATMDRLGTPPPDPTTPGMFALADRDRLRELVEAAGFAGVEIASLDSAQRFDSAEAWWQTTSDLAAAFAELLSNLPAEDRDAIHDDAFVRAEPFTAEDGSLDFPARILAASAVAP